MKLAFFTNPADRAAWAKREAELIRADGLARAVQDYADALSGKGKEDWLELNGIPRALADEYWKRHLDWHKKHVAALERNVRKLEKIAAEC